MKLMLDLNGKEKENGGGVLSPCSVRACVYNVHAPLSGNCMLLCP